LVQANAEIAERTGGHWDSDILRETIDTPTTHCPVEGGVGHGSRKLAEKLRNDRSDRAVAEYIE